MTKVVPILVGRPCHSRKLAADPHRGGLGLIHMGFVSKKVAMGQVFLREFRFSSVNIILAMPQTHISFTDHRDYKIFVTDSVVK
jgi:hypothetical protein